MFSNTLKQTVNRFVKTLMMYTSDNENGKQSLEEPFDLIRINFFSSYTGDHLYITLMFMQTFFLYKTYQNKMMVLLD